MNADAGSTNIPTMVVMSPPPAMATARTGYLVRASARQCDVSGVAVAEVTATNAAATA